MTMMYIYKVQPALCNIKEIAQECNTGEKPGQWKMYYHHYILHVLSSQWKMSYNFVNVNFVIQAQDAHNTQKQQIEHLKQQTTATRS